MKPLVRKDDLVYPELSYKLIGYAYEVFDELGPGHSEKTYQKAYAIMLRKNNYQFEEQVYYPVKFKGEIVSKGFLDFKIEEKVIIELKLDYLKRSNLKLSLLINFTKEGVKFKRIVNISQAVSS